MLPALCPGITSVFVMVVDNIIHVTTKKTETVKKKNEATCCLGLMRSGANVTLSDATKRLCLRPAFPGTRSLCRLLVDQDLVLVMLVRSLEYPVALGLDSVGLASTKNETTKKAKQRENHVFITGSSPLNTKL